MRIRKFRQKDAQEVSTIIKKGFQIANASHYSKESIQEQIENNSPEKIIEKSNTVHFFVAVTNDKILGIGGYDKERVHTFFVDSNEMRKGIGGKIMKRVLSEAAKRGIQTLDCWSTLSAEMFYASCGFCRMKRFTVQGTYSTIEFVLMRKTL